jgi:hypothetical protein
MIGGIGDSFGDSDERAHRVLNMNLTSERIPPNSELLSSIVFHSFP